MGKVDTKVLCPLCVPFFSFSTRFSASFVFVRMIAKSFVSSSIYRCLGKECENVRKVKELTTDQKVWGSTPYSCATLSLVTRMCYEAFCFGRATLSGRVMTFLSGK